MVQHRQEAIRMEGHVKHLDFHYSFGRDADRLEFSSPDPIH